MSGTCPACGTPASEPFHRRAGVPVNSCLLLEEQEKARSFPTGELALVLCQRCGFIWNAAFDPELTSYNADYEETQGFSGVFQDFIRDLSRAWVERYALAGKTVVEIGCGKGEFLVEMVRAGIAHGTGVDPGVHPNRVPEEVSEQTTWIRGFFPEDFAELAADAVVCRHTLEHIAPVGQWMRQFRAAIGDRTDTVVLFELPDAKRVLEDGAFWDVYYEHCSYFTAGSLARLFRSSGFEVLDVHRTYGDQYLLIEARPSTIPAAGEPFPIEDDVDQVRAATEHFVTSQAETLDRWRQRSRGVAEAGGRSVIWGSGSKGVAFLAALGEDSTLIHAAVDINPYKHERFMAGTGHEILSPRRLADLAPDLVVAMNDAYLEEIGRDLAGLGIRTELEAL